MNPLLTATSVAAAAFTGRYSARDATTDTSAAGVASGGNHGLFFAPIGGESIPPYVYGSVAKPSQRQRRKAWRRTQQFPTR